MAPMAGFRPRPRASCQVLSARVPGTGCGSSLTESLEKNHVTYIHFWWLAILSGGSWTECSSVIGQLMDQTGSQEAWLGQCRHLWTVPSNNVARAHTKCEGLIRLMWICVPGQHCTRSTVYKGSINR